MRRKKKIMIEEPTMNVVVEKKQLLNDLNHLRLVTDEYNKFLHRSESDGTWENDALDLIRHHHEELSRAKVSLKTMDLVSAILRELLKKLKVEDLTLKINDRVGEGENVSIESSGTSTMDTETAQKIISHFNVLSKNVPLVMQEKIRFLLVGIKNLFNSVIISNESDIEDSLIQINLLTSSKESQNLVREIAMIARDIYNTLNALSESIAVDSITESTEGISDAAGKLKGVVKKLEEAAFSNLDQLEELNNKVQTDEEICDRILDTLRKSQQKMGELKRTHPDHNKELSEMQDLLGDQIGSGIMLLKTNFHDNTQTFLSLIANQGFQDLTGQTLKKTIDFIETLELQLVDLLKKYRPIMGISSQKTMSEGDGEKEKDSGKVTQSQDQVDALLADFGF